jgi:hypothetical protein
MQQECRIHVTALHAIVWRVPSAIRKLRGKM